MVCPPKEKLILKLKTQKIPQNWNDMKLTKKVWWSREIKKLGFPEPNYFYQIQRKHWLGWKIRKNSRDNYNRGEENWYDGGVGKEHKYKKPKNRMRTRMKKLPHLLLIPWGGNN